MGNIQELVVGGVGRGLSFRASIAVALIWEGVDKL